MSTQTELVEGAMKVLREMPRNMQVTAAQAVLDYAGGDEDFPLSHEQVAEVQRRIADPHRNFLAFDDVHHRPRPFGV